MGVALAETLAERGANVSLVLGPVGLKANHPGITIIPVVSAAEMDAACQQIFPEADLTIMAAAVADYTVKAPAKEKIKKKDEQLQVELTRTKDILRSLGAIKKEGQVLVGFALETNDEEQHAVEKLRNKNADMIVLNSLNDPGAGFGHDTNKITIFDKSGQSFRFRYPYQKGSGPGYR